LDREEFEDLVAESFQDLPEEFQEELENIAVVVQQWPSRQQLVSVGLKHRTQLLGLYEGVPLTAGAQHHGPLPDKITIFQRPIERMCRSDREVRRRIAETLFHEIAHYFGIDDDRLDEIEREKRA